jgi:diaminohydroxyphosphoribosylaminopyrimidine deaminase/5-amino-6-(5-phosphoribosylamino)uracil reductase
MTSALAPHDVRHMQRALELARRGEGLVEPNPMVGCVIARGEAMVGEGWHTQFGAPHAEIEALRAAGPAAEGAALYVTLEPCCHQGKTPPCTDAIIAGNVARVVAAQLDPFPQVQGKGVQQLEQAGIRVEVGLLGDEARQLNAPYIKLHTTGRPWIIAKWAMSLDGKTATRTGDSQWISNEASRKRVHALRGRVDGIMVGSGTARKDDPRLTARPPGARTATRIVVDWHATLPSDSLLLSTLGDAPLLVAVGPFASPADVRRLGDAGCELLHCSDEAPPQRLAQLLDALGKRSMTNVLVEGGSRLLGALLDARAIDEVHVFIGPRMIGGADAPGAVAGSGVAGLCGALSLGQVQVECIEGDVYVRGRIAY